MSAMKRAAALRLAAAAALLVAAGCSSVPAPSREWIPKEDLYGLELWEGDRFLLQYLLEDRTEPFSLKLCYRGDTLTFAALNGKQM